MSIAMNSLVGTQPADVLLHGPTKILLHKYHWHSPDAGIVASYIPSDNDVKDHFGVFRGVDQIEAFAQATIVSCAAFKEREKLGCSFYELKQIFAPIFLGIGPVKFHNYLEKGDTFISIGVITFYKFRQMTCNGRIYKVTKDLNLDEYFSTYNDERLLNYDLSSDFTLVAELKDVTGRAIKKELLK
ncbi:MAG TPA: hypothetical protein VNW95_10580 [Mucilaginibacter sp.]|jgi:hypothetical protein|nr:hypothetical protein [Mucilaginibacter sp.]